MPEATPIWDEEFADRWAELHPTGDAEFNDDAEATSYDVGPLGPDCEVGKHHAWCSGDAWNLAGDELTECACECHAERPVVDVVETP